MLRERDLLGRGFEMNILTTENFAEALAHWRTSRNELQKLDARLCELETKMALVDVKLVEIAHNMRVIIDLLTKAKTSTQGIDTDPQSGLHNPVQ
jgi:hypothetical protein